MAVTYTGAAINTTGGTRVTAVTPAVGDLLVAMCLATNIVTDLTVTDNNADGLGTYTKVRSIGGSNSGIVQIWVRNARVGSATATNVTSVQTSSTGGGVAVFRVSGGNLVGAAAARSTGAITSGTAATTPAPVLSLTPLTSSAILTILDNTTASSVCVARAGYTEHIDTSYTAPGTGYHVTSRASGETSATLTFGGASPTTFYVAAVEIDVSTVITADVAGGITLAGQDTTLTTSTTPTAGALTLAGQTVTASGPGLATIGVTELLDTGATTDATSYTQATAGFAALSGTPAAGSYVYVAVDMSRGDTTNVVPPSSITVAGVTVPRIDHQPYKPSGANQMGHAVYVGTGSWSGTGWDTGALGFSCTGMRIAVYEVTGTTGVIQQAKATWITTATNYNITLPSATPDSANSRTFTMGGLNASAGSETLDVDFTVLADSAHTSPSQAMWVIWSNTAFQQITSTFHNTGANGGGISVELGAAAGGGGPTTTTITVDVPGALTLAGAAATLAELLTVGAGAITIAGQAPTLTTKIPSGAGAITLAGQAVVLTTKIPASSGALTLAGGTPVLTEAIAVAAGAITLAGQAVTLAGVIAATPGAITLTGQTVTAAGGGAPITTITVDVPGALTLAGGAAALGVQISSSAGSITLAGATPVLREVIAATAGVVALAGQAVVLTTKIPASSGALTLAGQTTTTSGTSTTTITVDIAGALTLAGGAASLRNDLRASFGSITLAGGQISVMRTTTPATGALTIAGQTLALRELLALSPGVISVAGGTLTFTGEIPPPVFTDNRADAAARDRDAQAIGGERASDLVTVDLRSLTSGGE